MIGVGEDGAQVSSKILKRARRPGAQPCEGGSWFASEGEARGAGAGRKVQAPRRGERTQRECKERKHLVYYTLNEAEMGMYCVSRSETRYY